MGFQKKEEEEAGCSFSKKELKYDIRKKHLKVTGMKTSLAWHIHNLIVLYFLANCPHFIQAIALAKHSWPKIKAAALMSTQSWEVYKQKLKGPLAKDS